MEIFPSGLCFSAVLFNEQPHLRHGIVHSLVFPLLEERQDFSKDAFKLLYQRLVSSHPWQCSAGSSHLPLPQLLEPHLKVSNWTLYQGLPEVYNPSDSRITRSSRADRLGEWRCFETTTFRSIRLPQGTFTHGEKWPNDGSGLELVCVSSLSVSALTLGATIGISVFSSFKRAKKERCTSTSEAVKNQH